MERYALIISVKLISINQALYPVAMLIAKCNMQHNALTTKSLGQIKILNYKEK